MIELNRPALVFAPMDGVTDAPMRAFMTERGGFTLCVSEFLRVSQEVPPAKVFRLYIPELDHESPLLKSHTPAGVPVQVQLLGGDAEKLAEAAFRACELGAPGIDLNFGCPAPTVNRHDGGATLLKYPLRIRGIVEAVRKAVPAHLPVSAKLRLGWDSMDPIHENAERAAEGGASWLTIHGRTKVQGYMPPAYWEPIGQVRSRLGIPVVANGEIWKFEDFLRCRDQTGCLHYMLGRGALADPGLPLQIAEELGISRPQGGEPAAATFPLDAAAWAPLFTRFVEFGREHLRQDHYSVRRIKQWLNLARKGRDIPWFDPLKHAQTLDEVFTVLLSTAP